MAVTDSDSSLILPDLTPATRSTPERKRSFAGARVIVALMLREMTTEYGRSPGGYIWAILEPVGMIALMSVAFSVMMRHPSLGSSFIVFYASGYLPYNQFRTLEKAINKSIGYSRGLLRYPVVTWLDAIFARFFLNLLTSVLNTILILGGTIYFTAPYMRLDLGPMVEAMILSATLALGIGTLNLLLIGIWPFWNSIYKIITKPLMIGSAILYILEDLPTSVANILWYNPLVHVTALMRSGVFITYNPQHISVPYVLLVSMVTMTIGLVFLRVHANDISGEE